jgi:FkbM family methyltransferase
MEKIRMKKYAWQDWDINHFKTLYPTIQSDPTKDLIHNRMGRLYWVWKDDALYVQRFARENGPYQGRNLKWLRNCLPNARTIIDVGMNVANNTMEYATWAKTVHGFEPTPMTYTLAEANVELNQHVELKGRYYNSQKICTEHDPNHHDGWFKYPDKTFASLTMTADVHIYNMGLGDIAGSFTMEDHPNNVGHNCIINEDRKQKTKYETYEVEVRTLDSFDFDDVDAIKIDCEGYEYPILKGSIQTIKTHRPVVQLEIVPEQCKRFGYEPQDMFDLFHNQIGDYVTTDFQGNDLGQDWERIKGVMDRFFVPKEIFQNVPKLSKARHPGMSKTGPDQTVLESLFEEI